MLINIDNVTVGIHVMMKLIKMSIWIKNLLSIREIYAHQPNYNLIFELIQISEFSHQLEKSFLYLLERGKERRQMIKFRFGHIKTNVWKKMIYIWFINHKLLKRTKSLIMIQVLLNCKTIQLFRGGGMGIIFSGEW